MNQSEFGRDLEASIDFITELYRRISLLVMHVTQRLEEREWRQWPSAGNGVYIGRSNDLGSTDSWLTRFCARFFDHSTIEGPHPAARVLCFGIQLRALKKPFEPVAHGILYEFDKPMTKIDWQWYWQATCAPYKVTTTPEGDPPMFAAVPTIEGAKEWAPLSRFHYFSVPLARVNSDEDVSRWIVEPLLALGIDGPKAAQALLASAGR